MDYKDDMKIAFSPDKNQMTVLSKYLLTICDINNPENGLSFDPWPTGRHVLNGKVAFQTSDHMVIYTLQRGDGVSDYYFSDHVPLWITPGPAHDRSQETQTYSWHPMA